MSEPLVSIVLPTYNGTRYLRQSVESCLVQTYSQLELIIVDDGSTEDISAVLSGLTDPRLQVIRHETNLGLPTALNTGFSHASGDFLTWTSDDNWYHPQAIASMVAFLRHYPDVAFVYADCWLVDEDGDIVGEFKVAEPEEWREETRNSIGACFLYRRQVLEVLGGYNPRFPMSEDYEYWLRVAERFKMAPYHRKLYYYRHHSDSLTGAHPPNTAARVALRVRRERGWLQPGEYRIRTSWLDKAEALDAFVAGDRWLARRKALATLIRNPRLIMSGEMMTPLLGRPVGSMMDDSIRRIRSVLKGQ